MAASLGRFRQMNSQEVSMSRSSAASNNCYCVSEVDPRLGSRHYCFFEKAREQITRFLLRSGTSRLLVLILLLTGLAEPVLARQDTLYMSVLNSRKHRIGALDNPTVGLFMSPDGGKTWQHKGPNVSRPACVLPSLSSVRAHEKSDGGIVE